MSDYDPVTGENWDRLTAAGAWSRSMDTANRQRRDWNLHGNPDKGFYWVYWAGRHSGKVEVRADGFHWQTKSNDLPFGAVMHQGVTTSVYEAYHSVTENGPVSYRELGSKLRMRE